MSAATRRVRVRPGLTLIELVVVLAILIALAGLLVPLLGDYLSAAHSSSSATNITECTKYVETFRARKFRYPNNLDSLLDNQTTAATITYVEMNGLITPVALTASSANSLTTAGITGIYRHLQTVPVGTYATDAVVNPPVAVADTVRVATITDPDSTTATTNEQIVEWFGPQAEVKAQTRFGGAANVLYVALGLGNGSELVGELVAEAPLHYEPNGGDPNTTYQRFVAVFAVDATGANAAYLVGVVGPDGESLREHLSEFSR